MIISRSVFIRMKNVSASCRENRTTFFYRFFFDNRAVYEIMWKNMLPPDRLQITTSRMRFTCWLITATNTHSEYVIFTVFPLQQLLHERPSMLSYKYVTCLVICNLCKLQISIPCHGSGSCLLVSDRASLFIRGLIYVRPVVYKVALRQVFVLMLLFILSLPFHCIRTSTTSTV
jgi:hypothetical protein